MRAGGDWRAASSDGAACSEGCCRRRSQHSCSHRCGRWGRAAGGTSCWKGERRAARYLQKEASASTPPAGRVGGAPRGIGRGRGREGCDVLSCASINNEKTCTSSFAQPLTPPPPPLRHRPLSTALGRASTPSLPPPQFGPPPSSGEAAPPKSKTCDSKYTPQNHSTIVDRISVSLSNPLSEKGWVPRNCLLVLCCFASGLDAH